MAKTPLADESVKMGGILNNLTAGMPKFARNIVYILCVPSMVAVFSIVVLQMALQIPFGPLARDYMEQQLLNQDKIIRDALETNRELIRSQVKADIGVRFDSLDSRLDTMTSAAKERDAYVNSRFIAIDEKLTGLEDRVNDMQTHGLRMQENWDRYEDWACGPVFKDGIPENDPPWCRK